MAAHADAKRKIEAMAAEEMQKADRRPEFAPGHEAAVLSMIAGGGIVGSVNHALQ